MVISRILSVIHCYNIIIIIYIKVLKVIRIIKERTRDIRMGVEFGYYLYQPTLYEIV